jgi:hypothetical protein
MAVTRQQLRWPEFKVGTGIAMTKQDVADRLGIALATLEQRIARRGTPRKVVRADGMGAAFPIEDGWAFHPDALQGGGGRLQPIPFWYERTVRAYGIQNGDLDERGEKRSAA